MVEVIETVLFAVLFGLDAYGYAKLKESERDIDRLARQTEAGQAESAKMASFYAQKNNEILTRGVPIAATPVQASAVSAGMTDVKMDSNEVADMREKIDAIEGNFENLSSKHDSLLERIDAMETVSGTADAGRLESRMDELERQVGELRGITTRVDELEHELKYASGGMDAEKMAEFSSRIEAIEAKITQQTSPEADDKTLAKLKEQNKKLSDLKERMLRNEEETGSLVGESGVNYATLLQKIDDGNTAIRKEIAAAIEKTRKEGDKTAATIERRVEAAEKSVKTETAKVEATLGRKVTAAEKTAQTIDKRISAVAKIAEKAGKTATAAPKAAARTTAPASKLAKKPAAARKPAAASRKRKATAKVRKTAGKSAASKAAKSPSVAHHIARTVREASEPTKTKVTVETTSGEAEVTTKKA